MQILVLQILTPAQEEITKLSSPWQESWCCEGSQVGRSRLKDTRWNRSHPRWWCLWANCWRKISYNQRVNCSKHSIWLGSVRQGLAGQSNSGTDFPCDIGWSIDQVLGNWRDSSEDKPNDRWWKRLRKTFRRDDYSEREQIHCTDSIQNSLQFSSVTVLSKQRRDSLISKENLMQRQTDEKDIKRSFKCFWYVSNRRSPFTKGCVCSRQMLLPTSTLCLQRFHYHQVTSCIRCLCNDHW